MVRSVALRKQKGGEGGGGSNDRVQRSMVGMATSPQHGGSYRSAEVALLGEHDAVPIWRRSSRPCVVVVDAGTRKAAFRRARALTAECEPSSRRDDKPVDEHGMHRTDLRTTDLTHLRHQKLTQGETECGLGTTTGLGPSLLVARCAEQQTVSKCWTIGSVRCGAFLINFYTK